MSFTLNLLLDHLNDQMILLVRKCLCRNWRQQELEQCELTGVRNTQRPDHTSRSSAYWECQDANTQISFPHVSRCCSMMHGLLLCLHVCVGVVSSWLCVCVCVCAVVNSAVEGVMSLGATGVGSWWVWKRSALMLCYLITGLIRWLSWHLTKTMFEVHTSVLSQWAEGEIFITYWQIETQRACFFGGWLFTIVEKKLSHHPVLPLFWFIIDQTWLNNTQCHQNKTKAISSFHLVS